MKKVALVALGLLVLPIGCDTDETPAPSTTACAEGNTIGDACAGVPTHTTGDTSSCAAVHTVATAGELDAALSGTQAGDCVILEAGRYAAVTLPGGVSLHGRGADLVTVDGITVSAGTSSIADLTVAVAGVVVKDGAEAKLSGTRVENSGDDGLLVEPGASASVKSSEIIGAARYGVSAFDSESVSIAQTVIEGSSGPGLWLQCSGGCACSDTVNGSIENTIVRNNRIVGISVVGAQLELDNVVVADTSVGTRFDAGGGISASGCSDVNATRLTVTGNADFGVLVDDSSLALEEATIDDNLRGLWVQAVGVSRSTDAVRVLDAVISGNEGVGFGVDKASSNVSLERCQITDTQLVALPVLVDGVSANVMDVGDGIAWLGTSEVRLVDVRLDNNARVGVLIDGPVASGSRIEDLTLGPMSGTLDLLQQNLPIDGLKPETSGTTPAIESDAAERLAIPSEVVIPPSI